MDLEALKKQLQIVDNCIADHAKLFATIKNNTAWDTSILSRKTASYGVPYNYSGINYAFLEMPRYLLNLSTLVNQYSAFEPNNCLINYYFDNNSKMGFHSDQIDILYPDTGVAIFSLGQERVMRFKNKADKNLIFDLDLKPGSYFYMSQQVQIYWLHSILPADNSIYDGERISLTFRKLLP